MKNVIAALAKFQQECPTIGRDAKADVTTKQGGQYSYKYATLDMIFTTIKPLLKKHGLAVSQPISIEDGVRYMTTKVWHVESGELLESKIDIPEYPMLGMNGYQVTGTAMTYFRRYSLEGIFGICAQDDNDAQGTQDPSKPTNKTPAAKPAAEAPVKTTAEAPAATGPAGPKSDHTPEGNPKKWLNRERPKGSGTITEDWANAVAYLRGDIPRDDGQEPKIADLELRFKISKAGREQIMNDTLNLDFLKPKDGEDLPPGEGQGSIPY